MSSDKSFFGDGQQGSSGSDSTSAQRQQSGKQWQQKHQSARPKPESDTQRQQPKVGANPQQQQHQQSLNFNNNNGGPGPNSSTEASAAKTADSPPEQNNSSGNPSGLDPEQKIELLVQKIKQLESETLRIMADKENSVKRIQKEAADSVKYASTKFIKDLCDPVDNFFRAVENVKGDSLQNNQELNDFFVGINHIKNQIMACFERNSIKRLVPVGETFDHNLHQAVSQAPSASHENGQITQVLQAGYIIEDRLLRAPLVVVAKND